jgi:CRP/FNR family transcriptional regulator, cyclic AMP receptor protein
MKTNKQPPPLADDLPSLLARIGRHPFLKDLDPSILSKLVIYSMPSEFAAGDVIFHEGEIANRFYLIEEGIVALELRVAQGIPVRIETIGAGEVLGWSWLFPPYTWHFDARAVVPVKGVFFYATRLREHCQEDSRLNLELMLRVTNVLVKRLNAMQRKFAAVSEAALQRI